MNTKTLRTPDGNKQKTKVSQAIKNNMKNMKITNNNNDNKIGFNIKKKKNLRSPTTQNHKDTGTTTHWPRNTSISPKSEISRLRGKGC